MLDERSLRDRLEADRRDLLDLSLRNPLLNYRPRVKGLEFSGESPVELFRLLVREGKALTFLPASVSPSVHPSEAEPIPPAPVASATFGNAGDLKLQTTLLAEELQARLLAIHHAARTALEEQGVNTLFLALGFLDWLVEGDDRRLRAPLILVPVELERSSVRERFRLRHDGEDLDLNLSLAEKLRAGFGLTLPELPEPEELEVAAYFDAVEEAARPLERWSVDREAAALGFFSFGKFLMYRDLDETNWPEQSRPDRHPVVQALLGEGFEGPPLVEDEENPVDRQPGMADLKLVLDADSTQTRALLDVAAGRSLVIQGPPGTGKSQTIANLIADAIGRGLRVLFVAEKMAALEVVKRRLDAVGLGEACLELHSYKMGKKAVLDQIRRTLGTSKPRPPGRTDRAGRLDDLRARLDAYCDAVNQPIGESEVSPHEAIGELLRLRAELADAEAAPGSIESLSGWSADGFEVRLEVVERLQDRLAGLKGLRAHPYFGARRLDWLPGDEETLRERLRVARHANRALRESAAALARFLRLPPAETRSGCQAMLRAAATAAEASGWHGVQIRGEWLSREDDLRELIEDGLSLSALRSRFESSLLPESWDRETADLRRILNTTGRRWWRWFSTDYRQARAGLAALCRTVPPSSLEHQLELLDAITDSRRLRDQIARHEALASRLFGRRWRGERSDWRALANTADGLRRLHVDIREGRLPRGLLDLLAEAPALAGLATLTRTVEAALTAHQSTLARLVEFLEFDESTRFGAEGGLAERGFTETDASLESWAHHVPGLDAVVGWNRLVATARAQGLEAVVRLAETWPEADRRLSAAFRQGWFEGLLRRAYRERPILAEFDGIAHERTIAAFADADRRALEVNRAMLARAHWERLPRQSAGGQLGALRRELAKRARHWPVRRLMAKAGNAVQAIKPVFLMSPLSVAAYLPPGILDFDLVVFDEASQVRPLDALGALLRGKQAVVVGDSRQLPPSSFFDRLTAGEDFDDDEPTSEVESVLGLFGAQGFPERMLRWHYRSRHESLIAVANRSFYEDRLVVFPSPDAGRTEAGLVFRHLPETVYDRGRTRTNPGEAEAVARAVMAFAKGQRERPPGQRLSLGVATFSAAQMNAVIDRIERLRRDEPAIEPFFDPGGDDPFFVKNLENVQGDERDVIFISIGYGRTADGSVSMNFGPLNMEGGERRLNVLMTRARVRCEVFTNLTADDIDPGRTRSVGVRRLRTFLAYAQTGRLEGDAPVGASDPAEGSAFPTAVADALRAAGLEVRLGEGAEGCRLDLAVADRARAGLDALGILGDGPNYRAAQSTRDRDRLRDEVLRKLGWKLVRAWSPDWHRDPESARRKVLEAIAVVPPVLEKAPEALQESGSPVPTEPPDSPDDPAPPADLPTYELARPADLAGLDLASIDVEQLAGAVAEVVRVEGPVHLSEVTRRVADAAELKRVGPRVQEAIDAAMRKAEDDGRIRRGGEFLWGPGRTEVVARDRAALPPASRKLDLVATEEIAAAIEKAVRDAFGIEPEAIPSAACRLLGFPRLSDEMRGRAASVVEGLVNAGRLVDRGGYLMPLSKEDHPTGNADLGGAAAR